LTDMRVMELSQKHNISEEDIETFKINHAQQLFIEEYLSNGMKSTAAAKHAVDSTSPEIKAKENPIQYYGMRGSAFLNAKAISAYLESILKKNVASTLDDVLNVVSQIMNDDTAEHKDRLKGAELLLKHYGAFEKHQNARANKSLTYNNIGAMTDKELQIELKKRLAQASGSDEAQIVD
jgi:hypothetical protein